MFRQVLDEGNKKLNEAGRGLAMTKGETGAASAQKATRAYFDSLQVELRMMDAVQATTEMKLYGHSFKTPAMVAALSSLNKIHPEGMVEVARGAVKAGAVMWSGIGSDDEMKAIIDTGAKLVKIVKPYGNEDKIFHKLETAEKLGALAVGMDISFFFGRKDGFMPAPMVPKTTEDMRRYVKATKLPFVLKGVLSEADALKALDIGAGGIVVSHHGGAVLDYTLPPLRILPRIARVINGRMPIFVDCGVSRGLDAFKSLARGATAVSVGAAVMAGLASGGADGVKTVFDGITEELQRAMSMTGARNLATIDPASVWDPR